jgi:hypothetical protein
MPTERCRGPILRCRVAACFISGDDRSSKGGNIDMRLRFAARREGDRFGQFKMRYTAEARAERRALMSLIRKL